MQVFGGLCFYNPILWQVCVCVCVFIEVSSGQPGSCPHSIVLIRDLRRLLLSLSRSLSLFFFLFFFVYLRPFFMQHIQRTCATCNCKSTLVLQNKSILVIRQLKERTWTQLVNDGKKYQLKTKLLYIIVALHHDQESQYLSVCLAVFLIQTQCWQGLW